MTKSRGINQPKFKWTPVCLELLTGLYATTRTADLAELIGCTLPQCYSKAGRLGLAKGAEFQTSDASGRIFKGGKLGVATQFKAGQVSWNKGKKGLTGVQDACRATQFKPGRPASEARNYCPIGSTRVTRDGILERKVTDDKTIVPARRWVNVARLVWEDTHGPIPAGHLVRFKQGMRTVVEAEITVDRLELVDRAEHARRNQGPIEIRRVIQLRGAITRQINKRLKESQ